MEIEIKSRKDNKLLKREEVYFTMHYEGKTPSRHKVRKQLKDILGKNIIVVEYIKPVYGIRQARGYVRAYSSEKQARTVEPHHIVKRNLADDGKPTPKESEEVPVEEPKDKLEKKAKETGES